MPWGANPTNPANQWGIRDGRSPSRTPTTTGPVQIQQQPNNPNAFQWSPQNVLGMFGNNPDMNSLLATLFPYANQQGSQATSIANAFATPAHALAQGVGHIGGLSNFVGQASLLDMLLRQGKSDPGAMNQQLAAIDRSTGAGQQGVRSELAQRGLSGSGVGQALQAAVGQAGSAQQANLRNEESQQAEQRRRQDLQLLLSLFINPSLDMSSMALNQYAQQNARKDARTGAMLGSLGSLGSLGAMFA
jgi:hypothetical protein